MEEVDNIYKLVNEKSHLFELIRGIGMTYAYLDLCVLVSVNMKAVPCFAPAVIPILHRSIVDGWMHVV